MFHSFHNSGYLYCEVEEFCNTLSNNEENVAKSYSQNTNIGKWRLMSINFILTYFFLLPIARESFSSSLIIVRLFFRYEGMKKGVTIYKSESEFQNKNPIPCLMGRIRMDCHPDYLGSYLTNPETRYYYDNSLKVSVTSSLPLSRDITNISFHRNQSCFTKLTTTLDFVITVSCCDLINNHLQ